MEETDVILLWGSNARDTHPIFFHHVLKAIHRGAKVYVMDPRRTSTAEWANGWLGLDVGTDIALANAVGHAILEEGLQNDRFIARSTQNIDAWRSAKYITKTLCSTIPRAESAVATKRSTALRA